MVVATPLPVERCCPVKKTNTRIENHDAFWALLAKGSTLIAACEAVGVDRRTGR
jgi:hypothetical protein